MIDTICKLIKADRIGACDLHLDALKECFPIFTASGHHNYLKPAYLYLQNLLVLSVKNSKVYELCKNELRVLEDVIEIGLGLVQILL